MQITILQAEIELAIKNHILSQIKVREGVDIDIQLSATRGPEGYTAIIDILPLGMEKPSRPVTRPRSRKARVIQTQQPPQTPAEDQQLVEAETAQEKVESEAAEIAAIPAAVVAEKPYSDPAPVLEARQEDVPPPKNPQSLFKDLRRPVNA